MKKITEESLPEIMKKVFTIEKNWSKTYLALLDRVNIQIKKDNYSSIDSNFRSIFTYELIRNKLNLDDFKKTIQTILKSSKDSEIESMYRRFFHAESEVGLSKYKTKDRFNNNFSCWTNMEYIFLDMESINSEKFKYKFFLNKETLPYLTQMLMGLDNKNILSLYGAGINRFVMKLMSHVEELVPLIKIAQSNPSFELEKDGYNHNFINMLINNISSQSYELSDQENAEIFKVMKENIIDFEKKCHENLISYKDSANRGTQKLTIDLSVFNFLLCNKIDIFKIINNKFLQAHNILKKDNIKEDNSVIREYYERRPYRDLIEEISSSVKIGLSKKKVSFDINKIDINAQITKNFVYFKFLDSQIANGYEIDTPILPEVINYINKSAKAEKDKEYIELSFDLNWHAIAKYCEYLKLDAEIKEKPEKLTKIVKRKILILKIYLYLFYISELTTFF